MEYVRKLFQVSDSARGRPVTLSRGKGATRRLRTLDTSLGTYERNPTSATPKRAGRSFSKTPSTPVKANQKTNKNPGRDRSYRRRKTRGHGKPTTPTTKQLISKKRLRTQRENKFQREKENERRLKQVKTYYIVLRSGKQYRSLGGWLH